jgi:hypothetical protein
MSTSRSTSLRVPAAGSSQLRRHAQVVLLGRSAPGHWDDVVELDFEVRKNLSVPRLLAGVVVTASDTHPHWRWYVPTAYQSGRQDLNLRPPGPQPEGYGIAQAIEPMFAGVYVSKCL